ncbi:MAG: helicase, partial [candidate division WOR-3 bacterium]
IKRGKDLFVGYKNYKINKDPTYLTFEDVYEKIKADKNTPKIQLSEKFWESYQQILNKSEHIPRIKTYAQSRESKAFNLLNYILRIDDERLKEHKKFISNLIEDIREFGTLSEYTLSLIIEWEKHLKDIDKLSQEIKKLKEEMGEDFLEKTRKYAKDTVEEIIIAIENQKEEIK